VTGSAEGAKGGCADGSGSGPETDAWWVSVWPLL